MPKWVNGFWLKTIQMTNAEKSFFKWESVPIANQPRRDVVVA